MIRLVDLIVRLLRLISIIMIRLLKHNFIKLLQINLEVLHWCWFLFSDFNILAFNPYLLVLAFVPRLSIFLIFVELKQLFNCGSLVHRWWQVTKRFAEVQTVTSVMQNVISDYLRQWLVIALVLTFRFKVDNLHQVFLANVFSNSNIFGAWGWHQELLRQLLLINKIVDDVF